MRVILADNTTMDVTDITQPIATHDYPCDWKHHTIPSGRKHVRVVYKIKGGEFKSKHFCPECWEEMNHD